MKTIYNADVAAAGTAAVNLSVKGSESMVVVWEVSDSGAAGDLGTVHMKAWAPSSTTVVNEVQTITYTAVSAGTYTLSLDGETTDPIAWNASAADIKNALAGLPSLDYDDVSVTGSGPFTVTFKGNLAGTNVSLLVEDETNLTGTIAITTATAGSTTTVDPYLIDNVITATNIAAKTRVAPRTTQVDRYDTRGLDVVTLTLTNAAAGTKNLRIHVGFE